MISSFLNDSSSLHHSSTVKIISIKVEHLHIEDVPMDQESSLVQFFQVELCCHAASILSSSAFKSLITGYRIPKPSHANSICDCLSTKKGSLCYQEYNMPSKALAEVKKL